MLSCSYKTGIVNQLLNVGLWTYTFDSEGNEIQKTSGSGEKWKYSYDLQNHMTSAIDINSSGVTVTYATYVYDVFGNRIEKDVWTQQSGTTAVSRYGYDGDQAWADLNSSNALQTRYLRGDSIDELFARIGAAGAAAWYLPDHIGSIRNLTDNTGSLIDTIAYDAYGNVNGESSPSNGDRYKWALLQFDSEISLYKADEREFSPSTGRWLEQDPLGFDAGDNNLYRYVENETTDTTDPSGMFRPDQCIYYYECPASPYTLMMENVLGPIPGKGGAVVWGINWKFEGVQPKKAGLIVQKLNITYNLHLVGKKFKVDPRWKHASNTAYFEIWNVEAGGKVVEGNTLKNGLGPYLQILQQDMDGNAQQLRLDDWANDWYVLTDLGRDWKHKRQPGWYRKVAGDLTLNGKATFYEGVSVEQLVKAGFPFKKYNVLTGAGLLYSMPQSGPRSKAGLLDYLNKNSDARSGTVSHFLHLKIKEVDAATTTTEEP